MPYVYRVSRRTELNRQPSTAGVTVSAAPAAGPPYRVLQAQAKALGIPTRQKAGKLKKAIAEAST